LFCEESGAERSGELGQRGEEKRGQETTGVNRKGRERERLNFNLSSSMLGQLF